MRFAVPGCVHGGLLDSHQPMHLAPQGGRFLLPFDALPLHHIAQPELGTLLLPTEVLESGLKGAYLTVALRLELEELRAHLRDRRLFLRIQFRQLRLEICLRVARQLRDEHIVLNEPLGGRALVSFQLDELCAQRGRVGAGRVAAALELLNQLRIRIPQCLHLLGENRLLLLGLLPDCRRLSAGGVQGVLEV